nr:hypothetical protein [Methylobacterium sp. L1A1]
MLKLDRYSGPFWLDLVPGVRVEVEPISVAAMLIAREAVAEVLAPGDGAEAEDADPREVNARASVALVRALCRRGIRRWEGVGDADGNPVAVSPETIDRLLDVWPVYDALDGLYVTPALRRSAEKNASVSSPAGTSAAAPPTAPPAA